MPVATRVFSSVRDAARFADGRRRDGQRVAFVPGEFDLLHPGHLKLLEAARSAADLVIAGVYGDGDVRAFLGPGRPVMPLLERAEILAALRQVDGILLLEGVTPDAAAREIVPDVLVASDGPGGASRSDGPTLPTMRVVLIDTGEPRSSSSLIDRARALPRGQATG